MPANTSPIFSAKGAIQWNPAILSAANTAKDGTGTVATVFVGNTANNNSGNFVHKLIARSLGTNVATVLRVFINNGSANATAANNSLIAEMTLPATTLSEVAAQFEYALALNLALPPGYKLNVTLGTGVAAGYAVTVIGGEY
ncbi:MAG: hypothetical protein KGO94_01340 [Alphaproteobacteria bacterium]|nr:hypothetical protein [Alphaproteobacteria bacterium]